MLGEFVEKNRQILILLLSVLIVAGSGVSLGFGIAELSGSSSPLQTSGFERAAPGDLGTVKPQPSGPKYQYGFGAEAGSAAGDRAEQGGGDCELPQRKRPF